MDVALGPWTAAMSVEEKYRAPLAKAMGEEAWSTVKNTAGFTPKEAPNGQPAKSGFTISGKLTNVLKNGSVIQVMSSYTLWVDGTFSNVQPVAGDGYAKDGATPEDALRAITEDRVKKLLAAIKSGQARKAR